MSVPSAPDSLPLGKGNIESGRAVVRPRTWDPNAAINRLRPAPSGFPDKARLRRCLAWQWTDHCLLLRLAAIALSGQRALAIESDRLLAKAHGMKDAADVDGLNAYTASA